MLILATLRRALADAVRDADAKQFAELAGVLEETRTRLTERMLADRLQEPRPAIARLVTADELADAHGVPASWFLDAARRGAVPHVRHGAHVRFDPAAVREALEDRPPLRRKRRRADHRIPENAEAEKASNGKALLPHRYHDERAESTEKGAATNDA